MRDSSVFFLRKAGIPPLMALALLLTACAGSSYMGISFEKGAATSELQQLASRARNGDKQAQLALGIVYEEGLGMPVDIPKAKKLYRLASSDSGGTLWVYSPPIGNGMSGRAIPVENGPKIHGLYEARTRLARLEGIRKGATPSCGCGTRCRKSDD